MMYRAEKVELLDSEEMLEEAPRRRTPHVSIRGLLVEPANSGLVQFFRYVITGGVALAADFGTLYLLTRFAGVYYLLSAIVAFLIGLLINYAVSSRWVFAHRSVGNRAIEFGIFAAVGIIGLGLNEFGLWLLSGVLGINYLWAKLLTSAIVFLWNFGARKAALFR